MTTEHRTRDSVQWTRSIGLSLIAGFWATAAGAFELLSNRNLEPGWTRYQPPWTVPVFVLGSVLLAFGTAVFVLSLTLRAKRRR